MVEVVVFVVVSVITRGVGLVDELPIPFLPVFVVVTVITKQVVLVDELPIPFLPLVSGKETCVINASHLEILNSSNSA